MATEVFDTSACPCCDATGTCGCCQADPPALIHFTLPTLTNSTSTCSLCEDHTGQEVPAVQSADCFWSGEDACGTSPVEDIFWALTLSCGGGDVIATIEVQVRSNFVVISEKFWEVNLGTSPIDCSNLTITGDAGDVSGGTAGGLCDIGDDITIQF